MEDFVPIATDLEDEQPLVGSIVDVQTFFERWVTPNDAPRQRESGKDREHDDPERSSTWHQRTRGPFVVDRVFRLDVQCGTRSAHAHLFLRLVEPP